MSPKRGDNPRLPDLSDAALAACADIAPDIDPHTAADSLLEQLQEWYDEHAETLADLGLGDLTQAFAVRVGDAGTNLLLPIGQWVGVGTALAGTVLVIPQHRAPNVTTWDDIRNDPNVHWWVRPDDAITGGCTEQGEEFDLEDYQSNVPFAFDGTDWEWTNSLGEDGRRWAINWQGDAGNFDLETAPLAYATEIDTMPAGELLEVWDNEIDWNFRVGDHGELWFGAGELGRTLIGRVPADAAPDAIVSAFWSSAFPGNLAFLNSSTLSAAEFRPIVDAMINFTDTDTDAESCDVSCTDFSGTAKEFIAATGGTKT
ncbi:MAG: hypothetical protein ACKOBG_12170 [Actinomycetota bacterium]